MKRASIGATCYTLTRLADLRARRASRMWINAVFVEFSARFKRASGSFFYCVRVSTGCWHCVAAINWQSKSWRQRTHALMLSAPLCNENKTYRG